MIEKAKDFAHRAHDAINQRRKYSGEPYWVHTDEVAGIVATVTSDVDMIVAAHLHDVLEDVFPLLNGWNYSLIEANFGSRAAGFVLDLTDIYTKKDFPNLNRKARHALENERLAKESKEVHTIKIADLISNTKDIVAADTGFARVYLREKAALMPMLANGDAVLWARAHSQIQDNASLLS